MKTTNYLIGIGMVLGAFTPAFGQSGAANTCNGRDPVGYLGISGIECDCTISTPGSPQEWRFRSEPRITSLEMDSRGGAVLKTGDVITHVNGKSIRTSEGARALADVRPGQAIILTVRRNGETLKYALTADSACPNDTRLFSIYTPGSPRMPPGVYGRATPAPAPRTAIGVRPAQGVGVAPTARAVYASMPRASFGMGLSCSGKCTMAFSERNGTATMSFSQPPEVYSIEKGGPADRAGIQRGDILTHINGKALDSDEAGRLFATAKPGETVRFTIQRGGDNKTVSVKAAHRTTPMPALAQTTESLDRARESLTHLQREQTEQLKRLQEHVRVSGRMEEERLREVQREMLEQERSHNRKLTELARELSNADSRMRAATGSAGVACAVPSPAPTAAGSMSRTLRYSGSLGESDIEVRGTNPVSVTENRDEVLITTGGTVVRIKKNKK